MSTNWRDSAKGETYSSIDDVLDETLRNTMTKFIEEKQTEPFEYDGYYFVAQSWVQKDRDTKQPVMKDGKEVWNKFVYRFNSDEKDKAIEKAKPYEKKGGGNFAPKKVFYETFEEAIPVPITDYQEQANQRQNFGKQILTANLVGNNGAVFYNPEGTMCVLMGKVFKVEL